MRNNMDENTKQWLIYLGIGAVSGWLGSKLVGGNTGLIGNILYGLIGSVVGGYLLGGKLGGGLSGTILTSAVGAAIVIFVVSLISKK
jgi:uncharacterized membrane protein YeaQ/YmgE (transglycosylase-associated protein family)